MEPGGLFIRLTIDEIQICHPKGCDFMRRMLAIILLLSLLSSAVPAFAASGKVPVGDEAQAFNAALAAKQIHKTTLSPGESFSFNRAVGTVSESSGYVPADAGSGEMIVGYGSAHAATALYLALKKLDSGAVSFDEICYAADGESLLTDPDGRDFRFTNLAAGAMRITYSAKDGKLICSVELDEVSATAAPELQRTASGKQNAVTLICCDDPGALSNLALAAATLYDTTLAPGDIFSFNDVIGPATADFGYAPGLDGRGEAISGGGVNQLASALWLLIQDRSDVVIVEKSTYGNAYAQTYVTNSSDAIFTDHASGADFSFRYTGSSAVTLYTAMEGNALTVSIQ